MHGRWGLLLVNLGTPARPDGAAVRRYLREFLSDPRVIDIHPLLRVLLLELVILPFRPAKTAEAYRKVWTERGSPLLVHSLDLLAKVRARLPGAPVELGMRYQEPSLAGALERLLAAGCDRVTLLPLYPQYASSATGSTVEEAFRLAGAMWNVPALHVVPPFYDHPAFLDAFAAVARPVLDELDPDVVMLSFHGLPERQIKKSDATGYGRHCLASASCCDAIVDANRMCYRAHCFATARGLVERLGVQGKSEVAFQSRLGRSPWIRPFTDVRVQELARAGKKRMAVLCPAFVADCLETLEEVGLRLRDDFRAAGGDELRLVPSLNATDAWADAVVRMAREAPPTA
jgi:protoporphyrin/coproporphyrin ferrochelatase